MELVFNKVTNIVKAESIIDVIVFWNLALNEQQNRTPTVLRNAINQRFNTNKSKVKS